MALEARKREAFFRGAALADLPPDVREALRSAAQSGSFAPRAVLYHQGDAAQGVLLLYDGQVKLASTFAGGRRAVLRLARGGDVLGLSSILLNQPHPATAQACTHCELGLVSRRDFLRLQNRHPEIMVWAAERVSAELYSTYQQIELLTARSTRARVAALVLKLVQAAEHGPRGAVQITQQEVAWSAGTTRESANRVLRRFCHDGVITFERGYIAVLQAGRLRAVAGIGANATR